MNATHDCRFKSAILRAMFVYWNVFTVIHSHFSVTNKPWVWRLLGSWHDFINGTSEYVWIHQVNWTASTRSMIVCPAYLAFQHTLGHHPYTNVDHADPDIVTAASVRQELVSTVLMQSASVVMYCCSGSAWSPSYQRYPDLASSLFPPASIHAHALWPGTIRSLQIQCILSVSCDTGLCSWQLRQESKISLLCFFIRRMVDYIFSFFCNAYFQCVCLKDLLGSPGPLHCTGSFSLVGKSSTTPTVLLFHCWLECLCGNW